MGLIDFSIPTHNILKSIQWILLKKYMKQSTLDITDLYIRETTISNTIIGNTQQLIQHSVLR